jgi:FKBP-type peptidyl-prolyl cis-trans isomerase
MRTVALAAAAALSLALHGSAAAQDAAAKPAPAPKAAAKPAAPGKDAAKPAAKADDARTLYGVGLAISRSLETFALTPAELEQVLKGVRDGVAGKPKFPLDQQAQTAINELARSRAPKAAEKSSARAREEGAPYLAKVAKDPKARKTASGAIVIPLQEGTGATPKETDKVKVNYTGTLVNGTVFDSTQGRGPTEFPLNQVIRCWTEALQTMKVGGKAKIVCPAAIAYGDRGSPPVIPGGAVLTFEVELLEVSSGQAQAPQTPAK